MGLSGIKVGVCGGELVLDRFLFFGGKAGGKEHLSDFTSILKI